MKTNDIPWFATNGQLSAMQRWRIALAAVGRRLAARRRTAVVGQMPPVDAGALDYLVPPRDSLSEAALAIASRVQAPWLLQHGLRTYAWATLLGMTEGCRIDATTLYAASLLHDLGLTDFAAEPPSHCFAVRGARAAMRIAEASGAARRQAESLAAAIAAHLDLTVAPELGVEARLLQAGAALDVLGTRVGTIAPEQRKAVLARHPRLGMKSGLCRCLEREAIQAPDTRVAFYVRRFDFLALIERAPIDD